MPSQMAQLRQPDGAAFQDEAKMVSGLTSLVALACNNDQCAETPFTREGTCLAG